MLINITQLSADTMMETQTLKTVSLQIARSAKLYHTLLLYAALGTYNLVFHTFPILFFF